MIFSVVILSWALHSKQEDGVFHQLGLPTLEYNQVQTVMYLKLSLSDLLSVAAVHTVGPFCARAPSIVLLYYTTVIPLCASTLLAVTGHLLQPISWTMIGFIWAFCLRCFILQDIVKVIVYTFLKMECQKKTVGWAGGRGRVGAEHHASKKTE